MGHILTMDGTLQSVSNDDFWNRGPKTLAAATYTLMSIQHNVYTLSKL